MKRSHWTTLTVLLALTAAAPALAAPAPVPIEDKSPTAWVPASAPAVLHLNGLHNLRDHLVAFLKNANPDNGNVDFIQKVTEDFFKNGVGGHKIRGVPKNGVIFLVCMDLKDSGHDLLGDILFSADETPNLALIAAVDDYKEFRDNLLVEEERKILKAEDGYESTVLDWEKKICFFVNKKDHVVLTFNKKTATAFAKGGPGLDGRMSQTEADRFLKSDVGLFLNMDVFNKDYADLVKNARQGLENQVKQVDQLPNQSMKPLAALAKDAIAPLFQAVDDSQGVLYTLDLHPEGLLLHVESELRPGTKTAALLKDFKPAAFKELDKMPPGQIYYVGMEIVPALFRLTGTMLFSTLNDPNGKSAKAIDDAVQEMLKAGPRARLLAVTVPPAGVELWQFDNPEKATAAQAKLIEATGAGLADAGVLKEKPEIKPHAQKYKGFDFTSVRLTWDLEKMKVGPGEFKEQAAALKKLLGDGLRLWFGTDGKTFLQVTALDWDSAEKQLDGYLKGDHPVSADKAFARARAEAPAEATVLIFINVVQYAELLAGPAKLLWGGGAVNLPEALKGKTSYVGLAATLQPERASLDVYVPAEAVDLVGPFLPFR